MKFSCDDCGAQYKIADEKIGPRGAKVRCKRCSTVIVVPPPGDLPESEDQAAAGPDEVFAGEAVEEEIGAAFDNIFGGEGEGAPGAAAPQAMESPRAAPSADDPFGSDVDDAFANALRGELDADGEGADEARDDDSNDAWEAPHREDPAELGAVWYVAVGDEQVGPLDLDGVQARWDSGDLTPDTLVWRAGLADWMPLSAVETLRKRLAPGPVETAPLGRTDPLGTEPAPTTPAGTELPEADAPAWKPAGASVLASLAAEEMAALDRAPTGGLAAPSADPVGAVDPLARPAVPAAGGFGLDLPAPASPPVQDPEPAPGPAPSAAPAPSLTSNRRGAEGWMTPGRLVVLVAGSALGVAALVVGALWAGGVFQQDGAPMAAAPIVDAGAPPEATPDAGALAAADLDGGADAGEDGDVDGGLAEGEADAGAPDGGDQTDGGAELAAATPAPEPPAAAKAPAPAPKKTTTRRRTTRRTTTTTSKPRPTPTRTVAKAPEPAPTRKAVSDDDLFGDSTDLEEELFGSKSTSRPSGSSASAPSNGGSRPSGYIPPEAGSRDLPKALSSGTLMMTLGQQKSALFKCKERQKAADASLSGRLVLSFKVQPSGRTSEVKCTNLQASEVCKCAREVVDGMKFPPYGGPQMDPVLFPLDF